MANQIKPTALLGGNTLTFNVNALNNLPIFFSQNLDADIKKHLTELDQLLRKRIFSTKTSDFKSELSKPLSPKRTPAAADLWAQGSLANFATKAEDKTKLTLAEFIEKRPPLSELKFAFDESEKGTSLDFNTKHVLSFPGIRNYLIALAYLKDRKELIGLKSFIFTADEGSKNVANYVIVSAARAMVDKKKQTVPFINDDDSPIVQALKKKDLSLSASSYKAAAQVVIDDFIFNDKETALIAAANIPDIPPDYVPELIKLIKNSKVEITPQNANVFVSAFISQIQSSDQIIETGEVDTAESDKDFEVIYLEDDSEQLEINRSSVLCAAQLFYSMVLGDELEVFNAANHLTHKFLVRNNIELRDSRLRENLQNYVFFRKFIAPKTKRLLECVQPAERQMFYRQVFNSGNARITEDVIVNREFPRLWKVLMLESAKFLERGQISPNPDNYVPRQGVAQAVEDLQYNLSTHCTGMANVITPLIYSELDFVTQRIFNHPVIRRHVAPGGGSWLKVVEELYTDMRRTRPRASVINTKAELGDKIIRAVANYNRATFQSSETFNPFITMVNQFITTQSILQKALGDDLSEGDDEGEDLDEKLGLNAGQYGNGNGNGYRMAPDLMNAPVGAGEAGEWDF